MTAPLPVTIIGGYLGAGKTTLINQMLRQADGQRLAVLVNEFGELAIDEDLIEAEEDGLVSIAGGCICCSFGSDLTQAMLDLAEMTPRPDHIVIESSGVALPGAIASSISMLEAYSVEGVVVLADCAGIKALAADEYVGDTIERQLNDADLLVLTKADLVTAGALGALQDWLAKDWPDTRVLQAEQGRVANAVLLGPFERAGAASSGGHRDGDYDSMAVTPSCAIDAVQVAQRLVASDLGIIRAKGYVDDISGKRALIQIVGQRAEVTFPEQTPKPGLVCIGLKGVLKKVAVKGIITLA